ncbi:IPT/TIG domain-containing protein, partial [Tessaracoccus lubricantis]
MYITPGTHLVNGRQWRTQCEPYSATERCRTEIWATVISFEKGKFVQDNGWAFNNLTYKTSPRELWKNNPLAASGVVGGTSQWTANDGRKWRTECDNENTGRGACRTYIEASVIAKTNTGYEWRVQWVFNSMVRLPVSAAPAPPTVGPTPTAAPEPSPTPVKTEPKAPGNVTATRTAATLAVAFSTPDDGGSPITGYTATCTSTAGSTRSATGTRSPLTVTGLTPGASYACTVKAINAVGASPASQASAPIRIPAPPTVTSISPASGPITGGTRVTVSGTDLIDVNAVTIGGKAVTWTSASATELTFTAPSNAEGAVNVTVRTAIGTSAPSVYTYFAVLPPLEGVAALAGDNLAALRWAPPAESGLTVVVERASTATGPWVTVGTAPASAGILSLTAPNGTAVWLRARLTRDPGVGPWTNPVSATPSVPTLCGSLTRNEIWSGTLVLGCDVNVRSHILLVTAGSDLTGRNVSVGSGGQIVFEGTATSRVSLTNYCDPNPNCLVALTADPGSRLSLRQTAVTGYSVHSNGEINLTNDAFVRSRVFASNGAPVVAGNVFSGADKPVSFQGTTDMSGVRDNTA